MEQARRDERVRELEAALAERTRELDELQRSSGRLRTDADAFRVEVAAALRELRRLSRRERELVADTRAVTSTLAAIKSSNSWRLLEAGRRLRYALRGPRMRIRGWLTTVRPRRASRIPRFVLDAPLGVNVAGYLSTESGMGEAARASIRSLDAAGVPRALNNVDSFLRKQDTSYAGFTTANPHPFNLVHLNADNMEDFRRRQGRAYFRDRYTIGYWFWELSKFRADWLPAFGHVDEVWVASEFGRASLDPVSPVPVVKMPLPVVPPEPMPVGRAHFGLRERPVVFLFMFDVSSQSERKNPRAVVRAFRRADLARDEAVLVLKYSNTVYDPDAVRLLREEAEGLNVVLLDGYMERAELAALLHVSDCYVSLHRAEGFGLTMAEAMRLGKPVIATAYSGNMDFMTPETAYLVDHRIVPLVRDHGPYLRGFVWAEPDVDHAARLIRDVVEHRDEAARRGRLAAERLAAHWHPERTGETVRRRLDAIRSGRRLDAGAGGPGE